MTSSNTDLYIYRTGDFNTPEEAYLSGALYIIPVDLTGEHVSTCAGFDLYSTLSAMEITANMFGFTPSEYAVVTLIDKRFISVDEYIELFDY